MSENRNTSENPTFEDAREFVESYYESLRSGVPLYPYFRENESVVKFGISERLDGYHEIERGLRRQTEETRDWSVSSRNPRVVEKKSYTRFTDDVKMEWVVVDTSERKRFDTRWSGVIDHEPYTFTQMHVSTAREL